MFWAAVVVVAALGLVPFTIASGGGPSAKFVSHCRGALVEAWPEGNPNGGGWFNYAPTTGVIVTSGQYNKIVCGAEARRRAMVPLLAVSLVAVAITIWQATRRDRGTGPDASASG